MKQFFKTVFASMLGVFLSTIIMFFFVFILLIGLASSLDSGKTASIKSDSILHLNLSGEVAERSNDNPFANFNPLSPSLETAIGLNDILDVIDKASRDEHVKGIYLDPSSLSAGMASMEEIRVALELFRKSGKFIYAYSDVYSQGSYYLASVADKIWMNPEGALDMRGMSASIPFFKGALDKLEVRPEIIRHGKFKSAVEPFLLDKMSDENRAQTAAYVESLWGHYLDGISNSRKIHSDSLKSYASNLKVKFAQDAVDLKLVDTLAYMDVFLKALCSKTGKESINDLELVTFKKYINVKDPGPEQDPTRDKIAVVYAVGDIVSGKGSEDEIGSESLSKTIRKVRLDKNIKAMVLRVNSPGGDALASDIIWRELELLRKEKPLIVSMGDVAASGGYYISCNADSVFAQPNTITGSIGVFGLMFNVQDMLRNKLGVTIDSYNTGPYADMGSLTRPLTESERAIMQSYVEKVYETFIGRVAAGRNMTIPDVDSIGQGRVWSGQDALRIGLVDALGGLEDAITVAAKRAKLDNYRLVSYPEVKGPLDQIIQEMSGEATTKSVKQLLGPGATFLDHLNRINKMNGIQARFIFDRIRY